MTPQEKKTMRARRKKIRRWKATRPNPGRPQAIVIRRLLEVNGICLRGGDCSLFADHEVTWQHLHEGVFKEAKRRWCKRHAVEFASKYGAVTKVES